ncbi:hypothetical protein GOODEAATRI_033339 [Goodea atripinnis]|uniref:Uncharacterized protein n=1 Tax=Goodea atripinnis TaxID=208336 RepID=A0ABV0MX77_9TELE
MAAERTEETTALSGESDVPPSESNEADGEKKKNGSTEPETEQTVSAAEPKMEDVDAEADEKKPAAADKAAKEVGNEDAAPTVTQEITSAHEEPERRPQSRPSLGDSNNEPNGEITIKDLKEEQDDDSRSSGIDCDKSTSASEDGEKSSGGDLEDKRRSSVEVSSSDGEPLSRLDSEDRLV